MERDWSRYWRSADSPIEAMHAHFARHAYHRHSHETYSFGVTDTGAQAFTCRGSAHVSAAGMVMAFNPDDPHDGSAGSSGGFTYRMIHIGPELIGDLLGENAERPARLPLFTEPVLDDPVLAHRLRALHRALTQGAPPLRRDELLAATVASITRAGASRPGRAASDLADAAFLADAAQWAVPAGPATRAGGPDASAAPTRTVAADRSDRAVVARGDRAAAATARELIRARFLEPVSSADLAAATGRSRFAAHRAFRSAYGMTPGEYQHQLRLREARHLIAAGRPISEAAAEAGFTDQSHLNRWFTRHYGITPGAYQRAAA